MSQRFDLAETPIEGGITLVEASAGTGKTYCLTGLVLRLLLEGKVEGIQRLLLVTFTNAATDELTARLRASLATAEARLAGRRRTPDDPFLDRLAERHGPAGAEVLRRALLAFDELSVTTIHGFAHRVLEEHALESGTAFRQEVAEGDEALLHGAARDAWRRLLYSAPELVATVVTTRRLEPTSFLPDYAASRRHPHTRIEPPAPPLDAAIEELEGAAENLRRTFDELPLRGFLGRLDFLKNKRLDNRTLDRRTAELAAFVEHGDAAGLAAAAELAPEVLADRVKKKARSTLRHQPTLGACGALHRAVEGFVHALRLRFLKEVHRRYEAHKRRAGHLTFDDLLARLHEALQDRRRGPVLERALARRFQAALIDEFQDTDLVQYEIFRRLFRRAPLFLVGDPKQAIYRFRGADIFAYLAAHSDADRLYTLDHNWRSTAPLVESVNRLFAAARRPFTFDQIPFQEVAPGNPDLPSLTGDGEPPFTWLWLRERLGSRQATELIHRAVALEIARLLRRKPRFGPGGRPLEAGDIAVLVRTNEQARDLREALRQAGLPAVISRAGNIYTSEEMVELEHLLRAVADPGHAAAVRTALTTRLWGGDAAELARLAEDDDAWQDRVETFAAYRDLWRKHGFVPMMQRLLDEEGVRPRLLQTPGGERRLTNLLHGVEMLHRAVVERRLSPTGLLRWLTTRRRHPPMADETAELRLESDSLAVQISTIHKSKGLEYEVVFCPFLWEHRPPGENPVSAHLDPRTVVLDYGSQRFEDHRRQARAEALAEDLRLVYVALTRARRRVYAVWGQIGRKGYGAASPLAWLFADALGVAVPEGPAAEAVEAVRKDLAARWDRPWDEMLRRFVANHTEFMALRPLAAGPTGTVPTGDPEAAAALDCRRFPPNKGQLEPWRVTSFTSLARPGAHDESGPTPVEPAPEPDPPLVEHPDRTDPPVAAPQEDVDPTGLFAFAQGSRAGTCLHEILEMTDLRQPRSTENHERVFETLTRHHLEAPDAHRRSPEPAEDFDPQAVVMDLLERLAEAPLPAPCDFTLGQLEPSAQRIEWPFFLPLHSMAPAHLQQRFAESGEGFVATHYAPRLAHLEHRILEGYLTGFVDLLFQHDGRWYLLDWKSSSPALRPAARRLAKRQSRSPLRCRRASYKTSPVGRSPRYKRRRSTRSPPPAPARAGRRPRPCGQAETRGTSRCRPVGPPGRSGARGTRTRRSPPAAGRTADNSE